MEDESLYSGKLMLLNEAIISTAAFEAPQPTQRKENNEADIGFDLPGVAILGPMGKLSKSVVASCMRCGFTSRQFISAQALISYQRPYSLKLVLVQQDLFDMSYRMLVNALQLNGFSRIILMGPSVGTCEFNSALEIGFDEVWPSAISPDSLCILLHKALQTASKLAAAKHRSFWRAGPLLIDQNSSACSLDGETFFLKRDSFILLSALASEYPGPVSRFDLERLTSRNSKDRSNASRAIDMTISRLRRKLDVLTNQRLSIMPVDKIGYRLQVADLGQIVNKN